MEDLQENKNIENMIYEIRGKQVMLDRNTNGTKDINKAVKRNIKKFPEDFYFQLTKEEFDKLRFQFGTANMVRSLPHVFTEEGVAMLSSVLKTETAAEVSVNIMRAFVKIKKYISKNLIQQSFINDMVIKHDNEITLLQKSFSKFEEKKVINEIYFNGQIYDAYSKIVDILKEAKEELIIIDAYADKTTLDMVKELKVSVTLIINERSKITNLDIEKYNAQYNNLKIIHNNTFHDRYFILDKKIVYHCGTSINDAGSKTFSINKMEDDSVAKLIINNINKNINLAKK